MLKKDLGLGLVIGAAVGLLAQPILTNVILGDIHIPEKNISAGFRLLVFIAFLLAGPLGIYLGHLLGRFHPVIYQFTKFAATGTLNSFINLGSLNILITLTGVTSGAGYSLLVLIGFLLATTNSFVWNKFWTFSAGEGGVKVGQTFAFYGLTAIGAIINVGVASFVVNGIPSPGIPAAAWANVGGLAGIAASFAWNFLGYKFFVFKKPVREAMNDPATPVP